VAFSTVPEKQVDLDRSGIVVVYSRSPGTLMLYCRITGSVHINLNLKDLMILLSITISNTKVAAKSSGNIGYPNISEPVRPCRSTVALVRCASVRAAYILVDDPL